jgi:hypothetical protein
MVRASQRPRRFVLLPKNPVTRAAIGRIVSRPARTGRAPLEGDYLKPRLSRGFLMTGLDHAQHGAPNDSDPPATHDRLASVRATEARQREKGGGHVARRCRHHAACGDWLYRARFCSSVRALVGHACSRGRPCRPHVTNRSNCPKGVTFVRCRTLISER